MSQPLTEVSCTTPCLLSLPADRSMGGSVLREYRVTSLPATAPAVLLWQEVTDLQVVADGDGLKAQWHPPAGARQVLVEHWRGSPENRPERPTTVAALVEEGLLVNNGLEKGQSYTYRVRCVYDGPDGQFLTEGITRTAIPTDVRGQDSGAASSATRGS